MEIKIEDIQKDKWELVEDRSTSSVIILPVLLQSSPPKKWVNIFNNYATNPMNLHSKQYTIDNQIIRIKCPYEEAQQYIDKLKLIIVDTNNEYNKCCDTSKKARKRKSDKQKKLKSDICKKLDELEY